MIGEEERVCLRVESRLLLKFFCVYFFGGVESGF